jgi:hypothetical protein
MNIITPVLLIDYSTSNPCILPYPVAAAKDGNKGDCHKASKSPGGGSPGQQDRAGSSKLRGCKSKVRVSLPTGRQMEAKMVSKI